MRWRTIIIAGVRGKFISLMKFINPVHINFPPRLIFVGQIRHFFGQIGRCLSKNRTGRDIFRGKTDPWTAQKPPNRRFNGLRRWH
jgi:hypothetical protein